MIKKSVEIDKENVVEAMREINCGKSSEFLPTLTIKEIEKHRDASGKQFPVCVRQNQS